MKVMLKWYAEGEHPFTPSGNMRKPILLDVCSWVNDAWQELHQDIIMRAFKKCCISNALDRTEDELLWENAMESENSAEATADEEEEIFKEDPYYSSCRMRNFMMDEGVQELL